MGANVRHDIDKERRDLYAVSLVLLIYQLAGGSLHDVSITPIGSVRFGAPEVLVTAAWASYAYFLWRFWLAAQGAWGRFRDDVDAEVSAGSAFRDWAKSVQFKRATLYQEAVDDPGRYDVMISKTGPDIRTRLQQEADMLKSVAETEGCFPPIRERTYFSGADFTRNTCEAFRKANGLAGVESAISGLYKLPALSRLRIVLAAMGLAMWRRRAFSDEILPMLVSVLPAVIGIGVLVV